MRTLYRMLPILAGTLLFAACTGPASSVAPAKSVQAEVITLQNESVPAMIEAPGSVQPRDRIVLSSQINGFVREVRVRAGDSVTAGQVLITLDARDADSQKDAAQASIQEAQAALAEARKGAEVARSMQTAAKASADLANGTYARYQKLAASRSVSPQELDEMRARRDAATADLAAKEAMVAAAEDRIPQIEARIAQASAQSRRADVYVDWTVVKAPSAGRIVERSVDPGSAIFPGGPLAIIESTSRPQVLASLPTTEAASLRNGLEVKILIPDQAKEPAQGRISEIIPLSTSGSHTVQFKVDVPADFTAVSGSFVKVAIPMGTRQALLVPIQAVRESGQLVGVFVVDSSGKARFRLVKTAPYDPQRVELLAGIEPGERIIAKLTDQIIDGISLEIR
jgi:multidrug efflux pump subunit AcrA (membrane-fusion protein)